MSAPALLHSHPSCCWPHSHSWPSSWLIPFLIHPSTYSILRPSSPSSVPVICCALSPAAPLLIPLIYLELALLILHTSFNLFHLPFAPPSPVTLLWSISRGLFLFLFFRASVVPAPCPHPLQNQSPSPLPVFRLTPPLTFNLRTPGLSCEGRGGLWCFEGCSEYKCEGRIQSDRGRFH